MEGAKFLRRVDIDDYFGTNTVSITIGGGGGTGTYDVDAFNPLIRIKVPPILPVPSVTSKVKAEAATSPESAIL